MSRVSINTDGAPSAIGPYSQAVKAGGFVFCSGQIALDPESEELTGGGTSVAEETGRALRNLQAVLKEAGATMNDIVKTTVYMKDLGQFAVMNEVYGEFFSEPYPARATVGVSELPKGGLVEIDAVAVCRS